jgi:hypothetical protein
MEKTKKDVQTVRTTEGVVTSVKELETTPSLSKYVLKRKSIHSPEVIKRAEEMEDAKLVQ